MKQRPYTTFAANLSDSVLYFCNTLIYWRRRRRHRLMKISVDIGAGWIGVVRKEDDHGMERNGMESNGIEYYVNR